MAAEFDFEGVFGALQRPGIAETEPLVGGFHLPAVANLLIEDAVLVANAIADGGNVERGEGIHEAGGETAESAVAQARLFFLLDERLEIEAQLAHGLLGFVVDAEVDEIVGEVRAGEELGGEVADDADVLGPVVEDGLNPALDQAVADGVRERHVEVVDGGPLARPALHEEEVVEEGVRQGMDAGGGPQGFEGTFRSEIGQSRSGHSMPRARD